MTHQQANKQLCVCDLYASFLHTLEISDDNDELCCCVLLLCCFFVSLLRWACAGDFVLYVCICVYGKCVWRYLKNKPKSSILCVCVCSVCLHIFTILQYSKRQKKIIKVFVEENKLKFKVVIFWSWIELIWILTDFLRNFFASFFVLFLFLVHFKK